MASRDAPERLITKIRESFPESVEIYMNGGCYGLFLVLQEVFPEADAYYDPIEGHVYTKIGDHFYDINGRVRPIDKLDRMRDSVDVMKKVHRWTPNYKL